MKNKLYFVIILAINTGLLSAGEFYGNSYGIYLDYNSNMHTASFPKLPGIPNCCPNFERGNGSGFSFGVFYERYLEEKLKFGLRLGYSTLNAVLKQTEETVLNINGEISEGEFEYILDAGLSAISLEAVFLYEPLSRLNLGAGLCIGPYLDMSFSQKEQIIKPEGYGTFLDPEGNDTYRRVRHEYSGDIPGAASYYVALISTISYGFPLNNNGSLLISPGMSYYYNITPVAKGLSWNAHALKFGLSIIFNP